jgi:putative oxidoreductase
MEANNSKTTRLQGWGIAVLRVVAGYLFLASGVDKLFINALPDLEGSLPMTISVALSLGELLCGAALVVGLLTRMVSGLLALLMLANLLVVHPPFGIFEQDQGYEYALLRLAVGIMLVLSGPGKIAVDNIRAIRRSPK